MDDETEDKIYCSPDINAIAEKICDSVLPLQSKEKYNTVYHKFQKWRELKAAPISENLLLEYFTELSTLMKCCSLWPTFSMLKSTVRIYDNIDIGTYTKLTAFLKKKSENYVPKKSKVLSDEEVTKFLTEAPDDKYLALKVALIFGIMGGLHVDEIISIVTDNVTEHDGIFLVKIPKAKRKKLKSFTIHDQYYNIVKKYQSLRPQNIRCSNRFFLTYRNKKCTVQPIGKNKIASMPREIATYLGLNEADRYTGHSFRKTSATLLGHTGGSDLLPLKQRQSSRLSNKKTESYKEDTITSKKKTVKCAINLPSTSSGSIEEQPSSSFTDKSSKPLNNKKIQTPSSSKVNLPRNGDKNEEVTVEPNTRQKHFQNIDIVFKDQKIQLPTNEFHNTSNIKPTNYYFSNCTITFQSPTLPTFRAECKNDA